MMLGSTELAIWQAVLLLLGTALSVECAWRLPLPPTLSRLNRLLQKVAWTLRISGVSDHWKQRAVNAYALRLLGLCLQVSAWVALAMLPLGLSVGIVARSWIVALSLLGMPSLWIGLSVLACLYAYARRPRG